MGRIKSKDLIMLLLYVPGHTGRIAEPIVGRTLVQKTVFLFEREVWPKFRKNAFIDEQDLPVFEAYRFGPFSEKVSDDLDFLYNLGYVSVQTRYGLVPEEDTGEAEARDDESQIDFSPSLRSAVDYDMEAYSLTEMGVLFTEKVLVPRVTESQMAAIAGLKANCTAARLQDVLGYVYRKYGDYTSKSEIRERYLK